jgi:hypothetical protein
MLIIKADGSREEFQPKKIIKTCLRAGATREKAEEIAKKISQRVKENWTTHKIYQMIITELDKIKNKSAFVVTIRHAIAKLGPENFELYCKKLLEAEGYTCEWNKIVKGRCIEHQIDVIAKRDKLYLVECKHHENPHRFCGLGIALQVQARLEDVKDGFSDKKNKYNFDVAWIFTNTKFSYHTKKYSAAKGIVLTGWGYKGDYALEKMAETKRIYPVTILRLGRDVEEKLLENNIITLQDMISDESIKSKLKRKEYNDIVSQAKHILA